MYQFTRLFYPISVTDNGNRQRCQRYCMRLDHAVAKRELGHELKRLLDYNKKRSLDATPQILCLDNDQYRRHLKPEPDWDYVPRISLQDTGVDALRMHLLAIGRRPLLRKLKSKVISELRRQIRKFEINLGDEDKKAKYHSSLEDGMRSLLCSIEKNVESYLGDLHGLFDRKVFALLQSKEEAYRKEAYSLTLKWWDTFNCNRLIALALYRRYGASLIPFQRLVEEYC